MDVKELIKKEYIGWDEVAELGESERIATIIQKPEPIKVFYNNKEKTRLSIMLELAADKGNFVKFRSNDRTLRNLAKEFGYDSDDWLGKVVKLEPFVYQVNKTGLELKPYNGTKPKQKMGDGIKNVGELLANQELMSSVGTIIKQMQNIKKEDKSK